jgi:hypothetical protein
MDGSGPRKVQLDVTMDANYRMEAHEEVLQSTRDSYTHLVGDEFLQGCTGNMCNAPIQ